VDTGPIATAHAAYHSIAQHIAELERSEQDRLRLVDLWSFQKKEIEQASLQAEEDVKLESEKRILANAEKLYAAAARAQQLLYESETSAATTLRSAAKSLQELAGYDPRFQEQLAALESARITVEDLSSSLRDYSQSIHASPERLVEIEDRLALIARLKRKYGETVEAVVAFGREAARKLNEIEDRDELLNTLRKDLTAARDEFLARARAASKQRSEKARRLEKLVEAEINDLAMKARFRVEIATSEEVAGWSACGMDAVSYLVATNPGEPLNPVEKIASGGELSRVMLALKATIESNQVSAARSKKQPGPEAAPRTLIFDEIDTGIGGRAAEAVGRKLKALSSANQVVCITHLPQIASFADQHYVIEKREKKDMKGVRVSTSIRRLTEAERTQEIARLLSGAQLTETSIKHAEQMLKTRV
jgi:DNA repair protein RecN (Recombination protein N)